MKLYNVWNTLNHPFIVSDQDLTPSLEKFALKNGLEEIHSQMHTQFL